MTLRFTGRAESFFSRAVLHRRLRAGAISLLLASAVSMMAGAVPAVAAGPGHLSSTDGQSVPMVQVDSLSVAVTGSTGLSVGLWASMPRMGDAFRLSAGVDAARDASDAAWQSLSLSAVWQARQAILPWRLYAGIGAHYDITAQKVAPHVLAGLQAFTLFVEAQQAVASSISRDVKPVYRLGLRVGF